MASEIKLPDRVYGHGWILSDEKKMSKSLGNILDPIEIIDKYGIDQLRYYLMKDVSLGNDGNISLENLTNCINNDLANNYGNLCQRVLTFVEKNCDNTIPIPSKRAEEDEVFNKKIINQVDKLRSLMNKQDINNYIKTVVNFSFEANKYFNDTEPWSLKKSDKIRMEQIIYTILVQIKNISILLNPIIPVATNKVFKMMNVNPEDCRIQNINNNDILKHKKKLNKKNILFKKVENDN